MFGLSATHLIIILIMVLVIFGAGKLPQVGKQLGSAINEFKESVNPKEKEEEKPKDKENGGTDA